MRRKTVPRSRIDLLRTIPAFAGCSDKELGWVDGLCDEIEVETLDVLMREGDIGKQAFVIIEGQAHVTVEGRRLATLGPGAVLGEMALVAGARRSATVVAASPMRVLVLGPRQFWTLLTKSVIAVRFLRTVVDRLRVMDATHVQAIS